MQSDFLQRPVVPDDLEALLRIERRSHPAAWTRNQLYWFLHRPRVTFHALTERRYPKTPIGFFVVADAPDKLYLANLAVTPAWRRRGVATFALRELEDIARMRGRPAIVLDVQESNLSAQLLYRKAGYLAVQVLRGHYGEEDGYRMRKELAPVPASSPR